MRPVQKIADAMALYSRYTGVSLRGQMQYKVSFWLLSAAQLIATSTEFLGIWALMRRFGSLRGWTLPEVALFYGLISVSFALADAFGRGFDVFPKMVQSGDFDRLLLRPRSVALQVAAQELLLTRIGRLSQGLVVLGWSMHALPIVWTAAKAGYLCATVAGGAALFYGLFVLQATLSFWTIESLEIMNILTYGGTEVGQYPMSIYRPGFRLFFTFVVPIACVNIIPARALLSTVSRSSMLAPLAGFVFLILVLQVWRIGVRHYTSTGS